MATNWEQVFTGGGGQSSTPTPGPAYQHAKQNANKGAFTSALEKTGLNNIPIIGGGILEPLAHGAEYVAEGAKAAGDLAGSKDFRHSLVSDPIGTLTGQTHGKVANKTSYMSPNDAQTVQGGGLPAIENGLSTGLQAGLAADFGLNLPGMAKSAVGAVKSLPDIARTVTGKGLWTKMVDSSTSPVDWNSVSSRAVANAQNQTAPVKQALMKILNEEGPQASTPIGDSAVSPVVGHAPIDTSYPGTVSSGPRMLPSKSTLMNDQPIVGDTAPRGSPNYNIPTGSESTPYQYATPGDQATHLMHPNVDTMGVENQVRSMGGINALEKRAALGQSIPKNFWGGSNLDSAQNKAYAVVRDALSQELKLANPKLAKYDKMYGMHQDIKSMAPKALGAVGVSGGALLGMDFLKGLLGHANGDSGNNQ